LILFLRYEGWNLKTNENGKSLQTLLKLLFNIPKYVEEAIEGGIGGEE
jgi:hypothetical protein